MSKRVWISFVLLTLVLSVGCNSSKKSSSEPSPEKEGGAQEAQETTGDKPATPAADTATPSATPDVQGGAEEGPVADDMAWLDTLRVAQNAAAYVALDAALGAKDARVISRREALGKAMAMEDPMAETFLRDLVTFVNSELKPYNHGTFRPHVSAINTMLSFAIGDASAAEFGAAARTAREAVPPLAQVGALLELAMGLKSVAAGHGPDGSPAFGVTHAVVCPSASWHAENSRFAALSQGALPNDVDVLASLAECYAGCDGVSAATDLSGIVAALQHCEGVTVPVSGVVGRELLSPLSVLGMLTVGELLAASARTSKGEWVVDNDVRKALESVVQERMDALTLAFDLSLVDPNTPQYPYLAAADAKTSYVLDIRT